MTTQTAEAAVSRWAETVAGVEAELAARLRTEAEAAEQRRADVRAALEGDKAAAARLKKAALDGPGSVELGEQLAEARAALDDANRDLAAARDEERRERIAELARARVATCAEVQAAAARLEAAFAAYDEAGARLASLEPGLSGQAKSPWRVRCVIGPKTARALDLPLVRPGDVKEFGDLETTERRWLARWLSGEADEAEVAAVPTPKTA